MNVSALVAVFLAATVTAGPVFPSASDQYKCAGYCKGGSKLSYEAGTSYVYDYTADTVTSVSGAGPEESRLHLSATVEIHSVSQCDFTLQLSNVKLEDSSPTSSMDRSPVERLPEFAEALERESLLFAFQDGVVDELCATQGEAPWVLNIKRGILSAFQNSMPSLVLDRQVFESDVTGDCETQYSAVHNDGTSALVKKSKNLLACAHRMDHFLSLQSTPYSSTAHAQSLPLVKSDHECYQNYRSGILVLALCNESHMFRPFSNGDNGAVTRVVQNLMHQKTVVDGKPGKAAEAVTRTTLLFQHGLEETEATSRAQTIVATLEELEQKTVDGVQSDVPRVFSQLVATLRTTSYPTLAKVFSHTRNQHTRKFLLDAMPLVGTADGLTVMTDLYENKEITEVEMDMWLTSLTFIKKPTHTMLLAVSSLLNANPRPNAVLAISSMVHGYCQRDSACREKDVVREIVGKMSKMLGDGCHVKGRKDMEQKIVSLKGIGNAGVMPSSLNTIIQCYKQADNPMEIRLAAIRAFRRMPCSEYRHSGLLDTYTDMLEDTELRIAAYLTVMQCPSPLILDKIKATLHAEEVNQVGSFVWTHLTNLQETSSRWKQSIRELISADSLRHKFQTDARKFSRNYEGSVFLDSLNAGATVESDVIFSPQSYLPRSAMLNLTMDIFGESINLFEVGTRAEGFEDILEDMFGPDGYFPDKSLQQVLQKARGNYNDADIENSIDQISSSFKAKSKLAKEPQASMYARVFGNEIHYARYQGLEEMLGGPTQLKNPLELLSKLFGGQEIDFTDSFVFLDASYKIPTIIGLPLEFSANGSATVGLKMNGKLDTRNLWRTGSAEISGKIIPSAAVRVTGTMTIDAFITKSGLETVSTLHTNTYLGGKVSVQRDSVDIKLDVPREKIDILEVSSRMFVLRSNEATEMAGISKFKEGFSDCTSETLSKVTGMSLCSSLSYANASLNPEAPSYPLTGPMVLKIQLLKTDSFDSYVLNMQSKCQQSTEIRVFKFDTPNSKIDRKLETFLSFDQENMAFVGKSISPFIKLEMDGKIDYNDNTKAVSVALRKNDVEMLNTRVGLLTTLKGHVIKYQPSMVLAVPKTVSIELLGNIYYVEGAKYSADFTLNGLTKDPLRFSADVVSEGNKHDIVGMIKSPVIEGSVHANLRQTNSYVSTKITLEYALHQANVESINLSAKIQSNNKGDFDKYSAYGSLQMSAAPQYNVLLSWDLLKSGYSLEHNVKFGLGPTEWQTKQMYRNTAKGNDVNFVAFCQFSCPSKKVDYKVDLQYKSSATSLKTHALAQVNSQHRFFTTFNYIFAEPNRELYTELTSPWYSTSLSGEVLETEPLHYTAKIVGKHSDNEASTTRNITLTSVYIDGGSSTHLDRSLMAELSGEIKALFQGSVVASMQKSNVWVEFVNIESSKKYRADLTYAKARMHVMEATILLDDRTYRSVISLQNEDKVKSLDIDLQLSKRINFAIKADIGKDAQEYEAKIFWDKDANPDRRIAIFASVSADKLTAQLDIPGQYIRAELRTLPSRVSGSLEWAPDQKMAAEVEWGWTGTGGAAAASLTTPFVGFEAQSIAAGYNGNGINVTLDTKLAWQKELLEFNLVGGQLSATGSTFGAEIHITSTIPSVADVYLDLKHTYRPELTSCFYIVEYNRQKVIDASWQSQKSVVTAELSYVSLVKTMPSINGKLNITNGNLSAKLNYGTDGALLIEMSSIDRTRTGYIELATPFETFENTSAKWYYSITTNRFGSDFKIEADLLHNGNSSSLSISKSRSEDWIVGSGIIKTPFTKSLEAGFTHSTSRNTFREGFSVALDGEQLILASLTGNFRSLRDLTLATDITTPTQTLTTSFKNQMIGNRFESTLGGTWNADWFMGSIKVEQTNKMGRLVATTSGSVFNKELIVEMEHNQETDGSYLTTLAFPGEISVSHELHIKDPLNWENTIVLKSSGKSGQIANTQSFEYNALEFSHEMLVDLNGSQATANLHYNLDANLNIVRKAEGVVTTPWTHPIKMYLHLPINDTTIQPKLKVQYQLDKEISVESVIFYQSRQSRFDLEIKSPFCKPITVKAYYDISLPTKAVLVTFRWEDKQMDLKSTVHLETNKAMGVLVATRSDIDGPIVNGQFKYDISKSKDMSGHLSLLYREKKFDVDLSGGLAMDSWKAKCDLTTPISNWEKLTALFDVNLSMDKKTADFLIARNLESVSLSATSVMNYRTSVLSLAVTSTVPAVKSFSMYSAIDQTPTDQNLEVVCSFTYDNLKAELKGKAQLHDEGLAELVLTMPVEGFEIISGHVRYNFKKSSEKSWAIIVNKNDFKVQMDGNLQVLERGGETYVKFTSPFEGLENIEAYLSHYYDYTEEADTLKTGMVLKRNQETMEMATSFVTSETGLTGTVECRTPIIGYKTLKGSLMIDGNGGVKKSAVVLSKEETNLELKAEIDITDLLNLKAKILALTPFKKVEDILAAVSYDLRENSDPSLAVQIRIGNELEIIMESSMVSGETNLVLSVNLPVLKIMPLKITGKYIEGQSIDIQADMRDQFVKFNAKLQDYDVIATILTSFKGFEKIDLKSSLEMDMESSIYFITINVRSGKANGMISISTNGDSQSPEIVVTIITPFVSWEKLIMEAKYDVSKAKKSASLVLTKLSEKYQASLECLSSHREGEWTVILKSPIRNFETLELNANYNLKKDLNARITLQKNTDKVEGIVLASHSNIKLSLETPWKDYKLFALAGKYQNTFGAKKISLTWERNNEKSNVDVTVKTNKDTITIVLNSPFNSCRTLTLSVSVTGSSSNKAVSLSIAKNSIAMMDIMGEFYLETKSHLGFNVTAMSPHLPPGYSRISIGSQYKIDQNQKSIQFHALRDGITVISADFNLIYGKDGELFGTSSIAGVFKSINKCTLVVQYIPKEMSVSSVWTSFKDDKIEKYIASFALTNTFLDIKLSSPIEGYENFYLLYKNHNSTLLVDFSTTFLYYDLIKLDCLINFFNNAENLISLSMTKDDEVITADWKLELENLFAKSFIAISTPFESYRKHILGIEYDLYGKNKAAIISVQKNNYTAKIESILRLQDKYLAEASLNITTSGKNLDNIKFYGSYDLKESSKTHLVLIGHWNDDWRVNVQFLLESPSPSVRKIKLFSMTPYSHTTFNVSGSYDLTYPSKLQSIEALFNILDIELSFSSIIEDNWKQGKLEGRCSRKDIITGSTMKWKLTNEKQEKGLHAVLDFGKNKKTDLKFSVKTNGYKNVSTSFTFVDFGLQSYDIETYWNVLESNAVSMFRYQWNSGRQINLESKLKFSPGSVVTNVKLSTPFDGLKQINFDGAWIVSEDSYDIKSALQLEEKQAMSFVLEFTMETFLFSFQTPISEPFILSISHAHSDTNIPPFSKVASESLKTNLQYGEWLAEVKVNLKFYAKGRTVVELTATTPVEGIQHLYLEGDVTINEKIAKLVLEKEESKFGLEMSLVPTDVQKEATLNIVVNTPFKDMEEIKISAMYNLMFGAKAQILSHRNQEEEIAIILTVVPNTLSLDVKTPIDWLRTLSVKAEADLNKSRSQIYFDLKLAEKKVLLQSSLEKTNDRKTTIDLLVSSSWTEELALSTTYDHLNNHQMSLTGRYGTRRPVEILGDLSLISEKQMLEFKVESSIEGLGDFSLKTGYDWKDQEKKAYLSAAVGETSLHIRAAGKVGENGISGDVQIDTPLAAFKLIEVKVQIDKNARAAQTGSLAFRVNKNVYELRYSSAFTANSLEGHLTFTTPHFKIDNAVLNLKHGKNFVFLNLGVDGKTLDFEGSYQLERTVSFLKANLRIPFVKSLEHLEIAVERNLEEETFKCTMQWSQVDQIIFTVNYSTLNFDLRLTTPFEKISYLLLTSKFTKDAISKNLLGKAVWNKAKIDVDGKMTLQPFDIDVSSQAEWGDSQVASTRAKLSAIEGKISSHILATIQDKEINLAGEIDTVDLTNMIVKLNIDIPFFDVTPITAVAQLKTQDNGRELLFQTNLPKAMYKIQTNYIFNNNNLKIGLDFDMPILKSNFLIGGALTNNGTNEVDGNIYVNDNKISASFKLQDKVITSSIDLNAPLLGVSNARIDIQASTQLSPDLHCSVTYRVGKYFGSVTTSVLTSNKAFNIRLDLDLPQYLGPLVHTSRFSAIYLGPHYSAEVRYDDGRSTRSSSLEIDLETDWTLVARATGPAIDTKEISFLFVKNWSLLKINLIDLLVVEAKHDQSSGSFNAVCFGKEHKLAYGVAHENDGLSAFLLMESPALKSKEMKLSVSYTNNDDNLEAEANFVVGSFVNQVVLKFSNLLQEKKLFELSVVKSSEDILNFFVSSESKNNMVENKIHLDYVRSPTFIVSLKHRTKWPIDVELQVSSTYLPHNFVEANLNIQDNAVSAYFGIGKKITNNFVSLVATFDPKSVSVEFLAPYIAMANKIKFNGVLKINEESHSMISFDGLFSSIFISEAQASFVFSLSNVGIDSSLKVTTPLKNYKSFMAVVQIPFVFGNNCDLNLSINFPQEINYALKARLRSETEEVELGFLTEFGANKLGADMKVVFEPVPALEISLNTPLQQFRNYRIQLRGQKSIREGDDIINYIEYNDKRIEIRHSTIAKPKKVLYRIQITTPFSGYERYVAGFEYDFNQHKQALVTLGFPGLAEDWTINFDFRFNNPRDLSFMTLIQAPIFTGFRVASFMIGNKLDGNSYRGVITGRYNEKELSITLDCNVEEALVNGEMKAQLNEHVLRIGIDYHIGEQLAVNGMIQVETPFEFLENARASGRIAPFDPNVMQAKVVYNSAEILDASLSINKRHIRKIQVINPWRPVYVAYSFLYEENISIWGEVCWDMMKMETSKFGGGFSLFNAPGARQEFTAMLKLPTRDISLNGTQQTSSSKKEYSTVISWGIQQTLGYTFLLEKPSETKWSSLVRMDFPFRSFEMSSRREQSSSRHSDCGIQLMWDAAADRNKKAGINFMRSPGNAELSIQHFALKDSLVFRIEHSEIEYWITPVDGEPRNLNIAFEYSAQPQDLVQLGIVIFKFAERSDSYFVVRHDASNINYQINFKTSQNAEETTTDLGINYLDTSGLKRTLGLFGKVSHKTPAIEMLAKTSENTLSLNSSLWSKVDGRNGFNINLVMNKKEPLTIEGRFNVKELTSELDFGYGDSRKYLLSANILSSRHIAADIRHTIYGTPSIDGQFNLRLNTSRHIWSKVMWTQNVVEKMKRTVFQEYSDVRIVAENIVIGFVEFVDQDFIGQLESVHIAISNATAEVGLLTDQEINLVLEDFAAMSNLFGEMYEANEFYLKDIHRFIMSSIAYAHEKASCLVKQVLDAFLAACSTVKSFAIHVADTLSIDLNKLAVTFKKLQAIGQSVTETTKKILKEMKVLSKQVRTTAINILIAVQDAGVQIDKLVGRTLANAEQISTQLIAHYARAMGLMMNSVQEHTILLHNSFAKIRSSVEDLVDTVVGTIMSVKEIQELVNLYNKYSSWIAEISMHKYIDEVIEYLTIVGETLVEDFHRMFEEYKEYIDTAANVVSNHLENVNQAPSVAFAKHLMETISQKLAWLWQYNDMSSEVQWAIRTLVESVNALIVDLAKELDEENEFETRIESKMIVTDNSIEISQNLPVDWNSFLELPKFSQFTQDNASNTNEFELNKFSNYITAAANEKMPNFMDTSKYLPPFGTMGIMMGRGHFITFDKKYYNIEGECSYLLASDLIDNTFSVVVNYHKEKGNVNKKSLVVLSEGHQIEILPNYRVTVDGVNTELPVFLEPSVEVTRQGHVIVVSYQDKMSVECNLYHDICTVQLSGFYLGKVGGLLGTFDNEPANDMDLPNGERTTDLSTFAEGWRVGNASQCRSLLPAEPKEEKTEYTKLCTALFTHRKSPLSTCFGPVQPEPFLAMCLSDGGAGVGICPAAIAYSLQCAGAGIDVKIPQDCVECGIPNSQDLQVGDSKVLDGREVSSADVVFVVAKGDCVDHVDLVRLATKLDNTMMQQGLAENRFAVVGVYGDQFVPQARTFKGSIWMNARSLEIALSGLHPEGAALRRYSYPNEVYDALDAASQLSFRPGVSKTVVLVQCSGCSSELDQPGLLRQFVDQDITLHVLQPRVVQMRGATMQRSKGKVFGTDASGVFTARNVKSIIPSGGLLREITLAEDSCAPIALQTNGTVFNLDRLTEAKKQQAGAKKFIDVWSRRVAQTAKPTGCQTCKCIVDKDGVGQIQCRRCSPSSVEQLLMDWKIMMDEEYALPSELQADKNTNFDENE